VCACDVSLLYILYCVCVRVTSLPDSRRVGYLYTDAEAQYTSAEVEVVEESVDVALRGVLSLPPEFALGPQSVANMLNGLSRLGLQAPPPAAPSSRTATTATLGEPAATASGASSRAVRASTPLLALVLDA
jgi:hypothetical protein